MNKHKKIKLLFLAALIGTVVLLGLLQIAKSHTSYETFMWVLLCGAIGFTGFSLGTKTRYRPTSTPEEPEERAKEKAPSKPCSRPPFHLHSVIDELTLLHTSHDLYERYQCFIRLAEDGLQQTLGRCCVTLWCLDHDQKHLVECLIPKITQKKYLNMPVTHDTPPPYRINLDCPVIQKGLKTQQPTLANSPDKIQSLLSQQTPSLHCDACIPLYRDFGQPIIVAIQQNDPFAAPSNSDDFNETAELIKLFWEQLQAANQRQWQSEHGETNKVLREQAFLEQSQQQATLAIRDDELFSLVVITIRGFRSMFAGQSQKWRLLSNLISQNLNLSLYNAKQNFMVGKMADDVFAIYLHDSDSFLAKAIMKNVLSDLDKLVNNAPAARTLDLHQIELQWTLADHQNFSHSIPEMLDTIYGELFSPQAGNSVYQHPIEITLADNEVEV